jgi:hypothetical protein
LQPAIISWEVLLCSAGCCLNPTVQLVGGLPSYRSIKTRSWCFSRDTIRFDIAPSGCYLVQPWIEHPAFTFMYFARKTRVSHRGKKFIKVDLELNIKFAIFHSQQIIY